MRPEDLCNQSRPEDPSNQLPPRLGATVGLIGAIIITIGFIVDTLGEGIELSETIKKDKIATKEAGQQQLQLQQIHNKLDYLMNEVNEIKRRG